eukprot:2929751-Pyramimonas_sp.AAC.1
MPQEECFFLASVSSDSYREVRPAHALFDAAPAGYLPRQRKHAAMRRFDPGICEGPDGAMALRRRDGM